MSQPWKSIQAGSVLSPGQGEAVGMGSMNCCLLPSPCALIEELICVLLMFHLEQTCLKGEGDSSLMALQPKQPSP